MADGRLSGKADWKSEERKAAILQMAQNEQKICHGNRMQTGGSRLEDIPQKASQKAAMENARYGGRNVCTV